MTQINKPRIEMEEMVKLYQKNRPCFKVNRVRIGKYAKYLGYSLQHQRENGVTTSFYVRKDLLCDNANKNQSF